MIPKRAIITIGQGEMSGVFNRGFLKLGYPLYPVLRGDDLNEMARQLPEPEMVLLAVGEADIHDVIASIPSSWSDRTILLQNELLPRDWQNSKLCDPTVISIWFEKKRGQDYKVIVPSPIFGPQARLLQDALATLEIPSWIVASNEELLFELVRKNLYILTTNISGLALPEGATVGELAHNHQELLQTVGSDILKIQYALIGRQLDTAALFEAMMAAFEGDPEHKCTGRSASARLQRAREIAIKADITVPALDEIAATLQGTA